MRLQGDTTRRVWVARERRCDTCIDQDILGRSPYTISHRKQHDTSDQEPCTDWTPGERISADLFHRLCPLRLKPGVGPVEVELAWKVVGDE